MKHHSKACARRSLRLQGYNYSKDGVYFITICVKDRACSLGKIENAEIILSAIGETANHYWLDISKHFSHAVIHEHIIMPNHVHGIIELSQSNIETCHVGTCHGMSPREDTTESVGTSHGMYLHDVSIVNTAIKKDTPLKQFIGREFGKPIPGSISTIINQYKSSVKRWCNKNNFRNFHWQSRFFDHIIRSGEDYIRISDYIVNNPIKWKEDKFYQQ